MANVKSEWANGNQPMPSPVGSEVVNVMLSVEAAAANLNLNDLLIVGELPEDCVMVDAIFYADDLDSGVAAVVLDFGTINAGETDLATTIESGLTIAQAGGAARLTPSVANSNVQGGANGQLVGFKVATAPATAQAGTVLCNFSYRSTAHGV